MGLFIPAEFELWCEHRGGQDPEHPACLPDWPSASYTEPGTTGGQTKVDLQSPGPLLSVSCPGLFCGNGTRAWHTQVTVCNEEQYKF